MPSNSAPSTRDQLHALAYLIERAHVVAPPRLLSVVRQAAAGFGAQVELLPVDFGQTQLMPLGEDEASSTRRPIPIQGSLAGRAYIQAAPVSTPLPDGGVLIIAPLLDGIERLGVLELRFAADDVESTLPQVRRFTELVTQFLATKGRVTDEFHRLRSVEPMTLAAQMQWQMLPPMTAHAPEVTIAGQIEPAYTVGGDAFDYAINWDHAHLAIFDAMGHGVPASVVTALAIGAYRTSRRGIHTLPATVRAMDAAVSEQFPDERFVTALLAQLDLATGRVEFLNAGHLQPLLLRGRQIVALPAITPGLPLGLGGLLPPIDDRVVEFQLEPGDRLLMVTDGVLDAVDETGEPFGVGRLMELTERTAHDRLGLAELARAITRGVYHYQNGKLRDDASLLVLEYAGRAADDTPPSTAPRPVL